MSGFRSELTLVDLRLSRFRVSSVLNRDVKQYGKKFMFDCNEETCWNSDQVKIQCASISVHFSVLVLASISSRLTSHSKICPFFAGKNTRNRHAVVLRHFRRSSHIYSISINWLVPWSVSSPSTMWFSILHQLFFFPALHSGTRVCIHCKLKNETFVTVHQDRLTHIQRSFEIFLMPSRQRCVFDRVKASGCLWSSPDRSRCLR